ncbi:carbonyl reductase [NADPH] 1-like isoform X1 [Lytechinus pictus]|uniref:carbonyl reductase [NADPH] 1-like isoform X1 n=2 Tax=Lytechinus pictus TaxID=7653 RepID=UPI0030B9B795
MSQKIALVTGSSTGIGLAIVRALCRHFGEKGAIYLTAKDESQDGMQAVKLLNSEGLNPRFNLLDVTNVASVEKLRDDIKAEHGGLDILINNAGIAFRGNDVPMSEQAERTIRTNYHGVRLVTKAFLPIIRNGGRVVNLASKAAPMAYYEMSEELQKRFREVTTEDGVTDLMNEFVEGTKVGDHVQKGWRDWAYGTSKLGIVALTRVNSESVSKVSSKTDVLINCCSPGYVLTDITSHHSGERAKMILTPEEGADTPVYLALLPAGTTNIQGKYLSKRAVKNFFEEDIRPFHPLD